MRLVLNPVDGTATFYDFKADNIGGVLTEDFTQLENTVMGIAFAAGNSNSSIINGLLSSNSELAQRIFSVLYGVAVNNTPSIVLDAKSRASFYVVNPAFSTVPVIIRMGADDHILNPGQIFLDDTYQGDVYSFAAQGSVKVIIQEFTSGNI